MVNAMAALADCCRNFLRPWFRTSGLFFMQALMLREGKIKKNYLRNIAAIQPMTGNEIICRAD